MDFEDVALSETAQFSHSVVSDSLRPHELQHARPPCPSPTAIVHPNPCPLTCWCHPTISSFAIPFSSCSQSFPASGSFQMSQLFASGGQSIGVSASTSALPMNTQDWSPLGWTGYCFLTFYSGTGIMPGTLHKLSCTTIHEVGIISILQMGKMRFTLLHTYEESQIKLIWLQSTMDLLSRVYSSRVFDMNLLNQTWKDVHHSSIYNSQDMEEP